MCAPQLFFLMDFLVNKADLYGSTFCELHKIKIKTAKMNPNRKETYAILFCLSSLSMLAVFYHCYQNYMKTWNSQHLIINLCNILNIYIRNNQLINTLNMCYVGVFCYVNVFSYFYVFCNVNVFCYNLVSFTI